jgi:hypothetical protein
LNAALRASGSLGDDVRAMSFSTFSMRVVTLLLLQNRKKFSSTLYILVLDDVRCMPA